MHIVNTYLGSWGINQQIPVWDLQIKPEVCVCVSYPVSQCGCHPETAYPCYEIHSEQSVSLMSGYLKHDNRACQQHSHNAIVHRNFQKYSVKYIYAIIDWVCLEFPKWCIVGYLLAYPIGSYFNSHWINSKQQLPKPLNVQVFFFQNASCDWNHKKVPVHGATTLWIKQGHRQRQYTKWIDKKCIIIFDQCINKILIVYLEWHF